MKRVLIHIISALFPTKRLRKTIRMKLHKNFSFSSQNINIIGKNNKIILVSSSGEKEIDNVCGFFISIIGNNNTVRIPEGYNINGRIDIRSDDCLIDIRSTKYLNLNVGTFSQSGQKLVIDIGTVIYGALMFLNEKNTSILIGKDCLFSGDIVIWPTDGHAILDKKHGKILNPIKHPVVIGDNCWIGYGVFMTKNTYLSPDTVVGAKSVVSNEFKESNIILAGNPAKIIKRDVQWHHQTPAFLEDERKQKK